ncbi:aminoglycoside N(3)-acetyltransferase [Yinghuangia sp. YIM S09857]|uniref:aminoglycoside N(3)-acetyltransferase n=1 Tax=Yinghuangia sp. YIM S09857 TaxID=3436929 RepID=UPI003F533227
MHEVARITDQLRALGLVEGDTVLVHSSLRRVGAVRDGAAGVLDALRTTVGHEQGTVVVPAFTPETSDSSDAYRKATAGMSADEVASYRATLPGFDAATTPASLEVGVLAEVVRRSPGSRRSAHPMGSFAALGHRAAEITRHHDPTCRFGERSPLGRLYETPGAKIVLLGTGFSACVAFHLAEYRLPGRRRRIYRCVTGGGPERRGSWWSHSDLVLDDRRFADIGTDYCAASETSVGPPRTGYVGSARATVVPLAAAVDFATAWHRGRETSPMAVVTRRAVTMSR